MSFTLQDQRKSLPLSLPPSISLSTSLQVSMRADLRFNTYIIKYTNYVLLLVLFVLSSISLGHQPGPTQGFYLLKESFSCHHFSLRYQVLDARDSPDLDLKDFTLNFQQTHIS